MSELMTVMEAANRLKLSESFLNKARSVGGGPRFVRLGRSIRYSAADLDTWASQRSFGSTSEYDEAARS